MDRVIPARSYNVIHTTKRMCDPPEGWKYGFPKAVPDYGVDLKAWLIKNGYPEEKTDDTVLNHCRFWNE